jgi:hypothetical protein
MSSSATSTSGQSGALHNYIGGRFHSNQFEAGFYLPAIMKCRLCFTAQESRKARNPVEYCVMDRNMYTVHYKENAFLP